MRLTIRKVAVVIAAGILATASACASTTPDDSQASETVRIFVGEYSRWAQAGYTGDIPEGLLAIATPSMASTLKSDGEWYSRGKVVQHGTLEVSTIQELDQKAGKERLAVTLNANRVTIYADGTLTFQDNNRLPRMIVSLVRSGPIFKVDSFTPEDQETPSDG